MHENILATINFLRFQDVISGRIRYDKCLCRTPPRAASDEEKLLVRRDFVEWREIEEKVSCSPCGGSWESFVLLFLVIPLRRTLSCVIGSIRWMSSLAGPFPL